VEVGFFPLLELVAHPFVSLGQELFGYLVMFHQAMDLRKDPRVFNPLQGFVLPQLRKPARSWALRFVEQPQVQITRDALPEATFLFVFTSQTSRHFIPSIKNFLSDYNSKNTYSQLRLTAAVFS
jgi:hypothetical protein